MVRNARSKLLFFNGAAPNETDSIVEPYARAPKQYGSLT
ncbi:hypothetical protein BFJ71_g1946 [Fusarium oxysporum]|nr:hypothetical protein BFJ71_g1946 [Fusarium oxysporum]